MTSDEIRPLDAKGAAGGEPTPLQRASDERSPDAPDSPETLASESEDLVEADEKNESDDEAEEADADDESDEPTFTLGGEDDDGPAPKRFDDSEARALAASCEKFADLPIDQRVQDAIVQLGWTVPTPVQKLCLPFTLKGREVAGFAQTGTGKTGVFLITASNKLLAEGRQTEDGDGRLPRVIVLAPTRELAMQIEDDAQNLLKHTGLTSVAIFGGVDYDKQAKRLRDGVDVIVATPGRLMDYTKKGVVKLNDVKVFVCDEADRMFDMGFIEDVEFFLKRIPETAQKLLFSATTNEQVKELAFEYLESPEYISVNPEVLTPEKIEQQAIHVHAKDKLKVMMGLLRDNNPDCAIIFTNTKLTADWLWFKLSRNGFEVDLITGDLPQKKRIRLIERIKRGELKALIATDVASRGLHISRVTHVYNFDLPDDPSNYIHRIGRTARAGARGTAISLVCDDYGQNLAGINQLLGSAHALTSAWFDEGYLKIEDKAGNPFQGRNRHREHGEAEPGDNQREREASGEGPQDRGPRRDRGDRPRHGARGERPERGPRGDRGPRPERAGEQGRNGDGADIEAIELDENGQPKKKRRRRRRRGKGGAEEGRGQQQRQPGQQQPQHGRSGAHQERGGRHQGGGRQDRGPRDSRHGGPRHSQQGRALAARPKSFFGMLKALFLSIFGRKPK